MFHSQHILELHCHPGLQKSNFTILIIRKSNEDTLLLKHGGFDSLSNLVSWSLPVFGRRGSAALTPGGGVVVVVVGRLVPVMMSQRNRQLISNTETKHFLKTGASMRNKSWTGAH